MATWFAQNSSVNIDSVNQWNDAAGGGGSWLTWASLAVGDVLVANGKTSITINVNVTCATLTTVATGGTAGGGFFLAAGVTVTANVVAGTTACIVRGASGASSFIVGNVTGGASSNAIGFTNSSTGTVTVTGAVSAGSGGFASGCSNSSTGTINIVGNVTAGPGPSQAYGVVNGAAGNVTVTGNATGGTSDSTYGAINNGSGGLTITGNVTGGSSTNAWGAGNAAGGLLTIIGNVISGSNASAYGAYNSSTGAVTVTGNVTGGTSRGAYNNSTGTLTINGDVNAGSGSGQYGIYSLSTGKCILNGNSVSNTFGDTGFVAARVLIPAATTISHTYRIDSGGAAGIARSLYTGGISVGHPATTDVRSGTTFGAASEYTGTLAVPSPTLVAIGVATDNTVGSYEPGGGASAADIADAVWDEARSGHTTAGTFGKTSEWVASGDTAGVTELLTRIPDATPGTEGGLPVLSADLTVAVELDSTATAALVDLIWDEPLTYATHNVATSSGKRLRQTTAFQQIDSTVIDAAATTTTFVTGLTSSVDNFYNDSMLVFTDGALAGQVRAIYDYIGATKTIILEEALTSAPVNGVAFAIVSLHIHPVSQIQSGLATAAALATESTKINRIEAVATGTVTGAGTSTEVFVGPSATLTITVDSSGNRSAVVVT